VRYPSASEIETILDRTTESAEPRAQPVFDGARILAMARLARQIPIAEDVRRYGVSLVLATHPDNALAPPATRKYVRYGSSPPGPAPGRRPADAPGGEVRAVPGPPLPRGPRRPPRRRRRLPAASPDPQLRGPGRGCPARPGRRGHPAGEDGDGAGGVTA